jgi:hypothetical protein
MSSDDAEDFESGRERSLREVGLALAGVAAFLFVSLVLRGFGIHFDTSYRVACAAASSALVYSLKSGFPDEKWPQRAFWISLLINIGILFTPLVDRPASRGEIILFFLPDGFVAAIAMIAHNRSWAASVRTQLIATIVLFAAACAALLGFVIFMAGRST